MGDFIFFKVRRIFIYALFGLILFFNQSCQYNDSLSEPYSISLTNTVGDAFNETYFFPSNWISENWWEMFNDSQLNAIVERALKNNPTIEHALQSVTLSHLESKDQLSPLLPQAEATFNDFLAGFNWTRKGLDSDLAALPTAVVPKWINVLTTLVNLRWTLDIWGKQRKLYEAAIDEKRMQMAEAAQTKLMISTQIVLAYFDLQYYFGLNDQQKEKLSILEQILSIQNELFANGLMDEQILQQQEKDILSLQNHNLVTAQNIESTQTTIKILMAQNPDDCVAFERPTSCFATSFPFPNEVPINLLIRRPDVVAKLWKIQSSVKKVRSAEMAFLPSIDLASFSGYLNLTWDYLLKPRGWFTSILPTATLPIFKGLNLRNNLQKGVKQYNLAVLDYNQMLLQAAKEVVDSITAFKISNEQLSFQSEVLSKSENLLQLSTSRYEYGLNTYIDVLKSRLNLVEDEMAENEYFRMQMLAVLNLIKSLGGGYQSHDLNKIKGDELLDGR